MIAYTTAILIPALLLGNNFIDQKSAIYMFLFGIVAATFVNIFFRPKIDTKEAMIKAIASMSHDDYVILNTFYMKRLALSDELFGGYAQIGRVEEKYFVKILSDDIYSEYKFRYYPIDMVQFVKDPDNICDKVYTGKKKIYGDFLLSIFPTTFHHVLHELHLPEVPDDLDKYVFA